jgi:hypothetical protein
MVMLDMVHLETEMRATMPVRGRENGRETIQDGETKKKGEEMHGPHREPLIFNMVLSFGTV